MLSIDPTLEVGTAETRIEVSGESSEILIKDSPLRDGNFQPAEVRNLPLLALNPISLARALSGATEAAENYVWDNGGSFPNGGWRRLFHQRPAPSREQLSGGRGPKTTTSFENLLLAILQDCRCRPGSFFPKEERT